MKIVLIGGGVMGEAILSSALKRQVFAASDVLVCEKVVERREELGTRYGVETTGDVQEALAQGDVAILAVKPQDISAVGGSTPAGSVALSVMAGVRIETIATLIGHSRIVRVMPNTPVTIQRGMSAWTATPSVSDEQRGFVRSLLSAIGDEVYLDSEAKIDMATALSGSGPAYVFLFAEALIDAGVSIGLPRGQAEKLAMQTIAGAADYAMASGKGPADLRAMVSSPGGTTVAGTRELERLGFRSAVIECVTAAFERAKELGNS